MFQIVSRRILVSIDLMNSYRNMNASLIYYFLFRAMSPTSIPNSSITSRSIVCVRLCTYFHHSCKLMSPAISFSVLERPAEACFVRKFYSNLKEIVFARLCTNTRTSSLYHFIILHVFHHPTFGPVFVKNFTPIDWKSFVHVRAHKRLFSVHRSIMSEPLSICEKLFRQPTGNVLRDITCRLQYDQEFTRNS